MVNEMHKIVTSGTASDNFYFQESGVRIWEKAEICKNLSFYSNIAIFRCKVSNTCVFILLRDQYSVSIVHHVLISRPKNTILVKLNIL